MASSKGRASRLRTAAIVAVLAGFAGGFLIGNLYPAQVAAQAAGIGTVEVTSYLNSPASGASAFNWLFASLIAGPLFVSAAVLYSASEMVGALRRSGGRVGRSMELDLDEG